MIFMRTSKSSKLPQDGAFRSASLITVTLGTVRKETHKVVNNVAVVKRVTEHILVVL
jgi:hypothetical protein